MCNTEKTNLKVVIGREECSLFVKVFFKTGKETWVLWDSFDHGLDHDWSSDKLRWYVEMLLEHRTGLWDVENFDILWVWDETWAMDVRK